MKNHFWNRPESNLVLFAWDGSNKFIKSADRFLSLLGDATVHSVHAMPHESIYSYGPVPKTSGRRTWPEQQLQDAYIRATASSKHLSSASFGLLFGERIHEIAACAADLNAKFILVPRFEQSSFSKWIHGDLNERVIEKANCSVILLDQETDLTTAIPFSATLKANLLPNEPT